VRLSVQGFRNLQPAVLEFDPVCNYLFGPNGAGKTNVLEAVHWLAIGRSFRRCSDNEVLGFGQELAAVAGLDDRGTRAEVRFDGQEKRVLLDGGRLDRLSEFLGWLPVVVLLLEDIELVRGGPGARRAFLDMVIAKSRRDYIGRLNEYRRVLLQRNRLLEDSANEELHLAWEVELARTGAAVYEARFGLAERLLERAGSILESFGVAAAALQYRPSVTAGPDLVRRLAERLAATRERSRELKQTVVGPHRDDFAVRADGRDLRRFGSVGEQRLAGVALRLAEGEVVAAAKGARPVFLLDEIASELDERRCGLVLDAVASRGQVIYAAARRLPQASFVETARDAAPGPGNGGREFSVAQGRVEEVQVG
jgi:DNA replication and repair protein RecF